MLFIPCSTLPDTGGNWFADFKVDKIIHALIFAVLVFMFCRPIQLKGFLTNLVTKIYFLIAILGTVYGFVMELIQKWFIPGRAFEGLDILADAVGCFIGYFVAKTIVKRQKPPTADDLQKQLLGMMDKYVKKEGPDRNQGRNQN